MPLRITLVEIISTFNFVFKDADERKKASDGWLNYIKTVCTTAPCKAKFNTGVVPLATIKKSQSPVFGGNDGTSFRWVPPSNIQAAIVRISSFTIRSGLYVESIMMKVSDGV